MSYFCAHPFEQDELVTRDSGLRDEIGVDVGDDRTGLRHRTTHDIGLRRPSGSRHPPEVANVPAIARLNRWVESDLGKTCSSDFVGAQLPAAQLVAHRDYVGEHRTESLVIGTRPHIAAGLRRRAG